MLSGAGTLEARYDGASADGSRVFFHSIDSLGDGDGDATTDVYMNLGGTITQISGTGNQSATFAATSTDGSRAFFTTEEDVAGTTDADGVLDAFRYEGGTRTLITVNTTQAATFNAHFCRRLDRVLQHARGADGGRRRRQQ